jgi:hypothetical protein
MTAVASSEDPHSLLSRLSLADSTSPSGANSPVPTTPEANVAHLARIQARRVAKIARAETALWKPITLAEAGRDVDPEQALKGKEVRLTPDGRARIVKRAGRNVYLTDGTAWQVQLDGASSSDRRAAPRYTGGGGGGDEGAGDGRHVGVGPGD